MSRRDGPVLLPGETNEWRTPAWLFEMWNRACGFTIDLCASRANHLLPRYYSREDDALEHDWRGERAWCNPPYDAKTLTRVLAKAHVTWGVADDPGHRTVPDPWHPAGFGAFLIPVKSHRKWWSDFVWCGEHPRPGVRVHFIRGALAFELDERKTTAFFASAIVIFGAEAPDENTLLTRGVVVCNVPRHGKQGQLVR